MVAVRLDEQAIGQNILILTYREIKRERKKQSHIHMTCHEIAFQTLLIYWHTTVSACRFGC